jgi:DNA-binding protein H-NS
MVIDLNSMSLKQLKALQADLAKAITSYADRQKREAAVALEARARELGFSLAELAGSTGKKSRGGTPKYANPDEPSTTWSGKGRRPQWFDAALAAGKSKDDLLI